jgi:hypothetical protein
MNKIVPSIGSAEVGPLGVLHLPRAQVLREIGPSEDEIDDLHHAKILVRDESLGSSSSIAFSSFSYRRRTDGDSLTATKGRCRSA